MVLLGSCAPKIILTSTEYVKVEVHDTTLYPKLVPYDSSVKIKDTASRLENPYAVSYAMFSDGYLSHSLRIKDIAVPLTVSVPTTTITTVKQVNVLTKEQAAKIKAYDGLIKDKKDLTIKVDKLQASDKAKTAKIWRLVCIIALLTIWTLRKPIIWLASKAIKPI